MPRSAVSPYQNGRCVNTDRAWSNPSMRQQTLDEVSSDVQCPTCGDTFASERGVKIHHAKAHGESIAGIEVTCSWCGGEKTMEPRAVRNSERHFCDSECHGAWMSENQTGEDSPTWSGGEVTVDCSWCGTEKTVKQYRLGRSDRYFCGSDCHGLWMSRHYTGENSRSWKGGKITVECSWCGDGKAVWPGHREEFERAFCDKECVGKWLAENRSGEDAPRWEGGHEAYYGPSWPTQRRRAIDRDGGRCVLCGRSRESHHKLYDRDIEVHHKIPFRKFGVENHKRANRLENLITVCQSCHHDIEGLYTGEADPNSGTAD